MATRARARASAGERGRESARARAREAKERSRRRKNERNAKKTKNDEGAKERKAILLLFSPSFLYLSIESVLTTYNSDPMDGLREIHFGERSLSLSYLYKNDSRRCMPLLLTAPAADLLVVLPAPACWFVADVGETLWWELSAPRADADEPSTSKLKQKSRTAGF